MADNEKTSKAAVGRQLIEKYGGGGFRIAGVRYTGSVLVFPDQTLAWPVADAGEVSAASFSEVISRAPRPRILIIGCGPSFAPRPDGTAAALRGAGIGIEWMDTGAACRTFNVLLLEDREVAAALIAVE